MYRYDPIFRFSCGYLWIILWWRIWLWINSYIFTICISLTKHSEDSWVTADRWILSKLVWHVISHRFMMRTSRTRTRKDSSTKVKMFCREKIFLDWKLAESERNWSYLKTTFTQSRIVQNHLSFTIHIWSKIHLFL